MTSGGQTTAGDSGESSVNSERPAWLRDRTEFVSFRLGGGLGWGSPGSVAGIAHLALDLGVWRHLAFGLEVVGGGGADIDILDLRGDSLSGVNLRVVGRYYLLRERLLLTAAVAIGHGWYEATDVSVCSDADVGGSDTFCTYEGPGTVRASETRHGTGVSYAVELGASARVGTARVGGVVRGDSVDGHVGSITFGPTFGLVF